MTMDNILEVITKMSPEELQEIKEAVIAADPPSIERAMFERYGLKKGDRVKVDGELVINARRVKQPIMWVHHFKRARKKPVVVVSSKPDYFLNYYTFVPTKLTHV